MITLMKDVLQDFNGPHLQVTSVVLCQIFIVSVMEHSHEVHSLIQKKHDDPGREWFRYHRNSVDRSLFLWNQIKTLCFDESRDAELIPKFSISEVTKKLLDIVKLPSTNLVLLLDEGGSLITFSRIAFAHDWNLSRTI
ncbi:hypothetical protein GEMRC1_011384 [Eukaryota sp. GEM-RC1]